MSLRGAIRMVLTRLGYCLLEAANGEEALALWAVHSDEIQLMITDLMMPGKMNGEELARQVLQKKPQLKVIYVSGHSPEIIGKDLLLQERANFLSKPFAPSHLAETIRKSLDTS